jgi:hypothetical protein
MRLRSIFVSPKIVCLITFDYEISLGRNFLPPDEVLFKPTGKVLELCGQLGCPVTFFPDVCSVWAHRKFGLTEYADSFEAQMKGAVKAGHDIQLHLHPHWLASTFDGDQWLISTEKMYLHELDFGDGPESAGALVGRGVNYLNDLLRPTKPDYGCIAFRAAGSALQPRENEIIRVLLDCGIKMDVSVTKFLTLNLDTVKIDYSEVPARSIWRMSPESGIRAEAIDGLLEVPIATFRSGFGARIGFLLRRARSIKQMRGMTLSRAKHQSRLANLRTMLLQNLRYVIGNPWYILSCDTKGFDSRMLLDGFKQYIAKHNGEETVYVTMMNHPKLMFDYQLKLLRDFIVQARQEYDIAFATCTDVFDMHFGNSKA